MNIVLVVTTKLTCVKSWTLCSLSILFKQRILVDFASNSCLKMFAVVVISANNLEYVQVQIDIDCFPSEETLVSHLFFFSSVWGVGTKRSMSMLSLWSFLLSSNTWSVTRRICCALLDQLSFLDCHVCKHYRPGFCEKNPPTHWVIFSRQTTRPRWL